MNKNDFVLREGFLEKYKTKKPPFGFNGFGELVFLRTYSRIKENGENEKWWECVKRVVEGTYTMQKEWIETYSLGWNAHKAQLSAQQMYDKIFYMKFLPPGRGLWAMGSPITMEKKLFAALNNCFAYQTQILTMQGFKQIGDLVNTNQIILTKNGKWVEAPIKSYGKQKLFKLVLQRQGIEKVIFTTENHLWFAKSQSEINHSKGFNIYKTINLKPGYRLQYMFGQTQHNFSPQGIQHGICFGDGTFNHLYLIGEKDSQLIKWFPLNKKSEAPEKDAVRIADLPAHFKELPSIRFDKKYLLGWLMGYFAADGSVTNGQVTISSSKKENLEFLRDAAAICGIGVYDIRLSSEASNFKEERVLWELTFMPDTLTKDFFLIEAHKNQFTSNVIKRNWNVVSVEDTDKVEEVYCAEVVDYESFTIEGNILTHNCSYVSTENIKEDLAKPFCFLMDMSMLGVGVGFDTKGAEKIEIKGPDKSRQKYIYQIADSREGWVHSVRLLLESYFLNISPIEFDYSLIRPSGTPIKTFGGISSGAQPLIDCHISLRQVLDKNIGLPISITTIADIMNLLGKCVVSGNVRRSAEIIFGDYQSEEYLKLKDYKWDGSKNEYIGSRKERANYGWASNNSIFADLGMDYTEVATQTANNGEPGYAWLENMKNYSRMNNGPDFKDVKVSGGNPCLEQSLESYELCCVSANTKIQCRDGVFKIIDIVNKDKEIWNGEEWSIVSPFKAASNKELFRVWLSDGSYLDCTKDHKWSVKPINKRIFRQTETKDLCLGDKVYSFEISAPYNGKYEENAYEWGLFAGDGYIDGNKPMLIVCGNKRKLMDLDIKGIWYKKQIKEGYSEPINRLSFKDVLNLEKAIELNDKTKGLPDWVFELDKESILHFVAGYIETDGNVCRQVNSDNYRIFGNEEKIRDLQILLRRIGINHASIYKVGEEGDETNFGTRNYALWCCYIPSYECAGIPTRIKKANKIGSRYKVNNVYTETVIDAARKQKVVKIEKLEGLYDTYCFTEPNTHMGVFGNVLTYQCLVETFPANHESLEEFKSTLKFAYLYAKTVTLGQTHWPETNRVMLRNRRIGCSMSGIVQFITERGIHTLREWCEEGYKAIEYYDTIYSDWLAIPKSIKKTSVKPSGSVSLLAGATPGVHYPEGRYYIRRIRLAKDSELIAPLKEAGYHIEPDISNEKTTVVVEWPIAQEGLRTINEVSLWEQLSLAAFMQRHWADNQVSCTVTFKELEKEQIKYALNYFQYQLKGISFLPKLEQKVYKQMVYEEINKEKYEQLIKKLKPVKFGKIKNELANVDKFCSNDKCELK